MSEKNTLSKYAPYLSLGLEIAVGVALPVIIGYWLDNYFGSSPWLVLTGCLLGMINVFVIIFRLNKKLNNES